MDAKPDIYSNRWYQEQLTGFQHLLNRLAAEYDAQYKRSEALSRIVEKLTQECAARDARIGELIARVETVESRVEKASKVVADLAKKNGKTA